MSMSAFDRFKLLVHYPDIYAFTDPQIQEFLDMEKVADEDGYRPNEDGYTATYNVDRAAGRAWLWLGGQESNKLTSYRVGDISVQVDKAYCMSRARELLGGESVSAPRRDETDKRATHDGPDPRFRTA